MNQTKEKHLNFNLYLPTAQKEKLKAEAKKRGLSLSSFLRMAGLQLISPKS